MLTPEEQELLGVAMVTRLRLALVHTRDWSDSNTSRSEPKRRRGSTGAPLSVPSWPGSDEATRVWGGPVPEVIGTSSLASGDAPMLTLDENMSSAGGGSQGSPPSAAMVGVYMATTGTGTGHPYTTEQPTFYVPVAEYPPGQNARLPPHELLPAASPVRGDGPGSSEEETKSDAPMTARDPHLPGNSRDRDQDLREADRQILELCAALATRDELEQIRHETYRAARTGQAHQAKLYQEAWEYRKAEVARETERRKASDQNFASLQAKVYLLENERAQNREEGTQLRAETASRMEDVTEKCGQPVSKVTAATDETKLQADEELSRIRREMEHQVQESRPQRPGRLTPRRFS
ncbi:LOW QUALITY PROTEIN: hypothetical protein PHMEG_00024248 [Phytophthora megakarya]|uniref:Uncharacterized protein n=1 Tax=Phytophthora megakarya TaxID=4795 RepID=A0A225VGM7_9STRA|nr:LOW QUALITY PROTEIN: hypothetical protein PHMEG_00024248 [Phytophthora megakarya]